MITLDFAPAPGAAPAATRVLRHARTEAGLLLRNGEQLLLALVIPAGIVILGRLSGGLLGDFRTLVPSVLALAVWSSAFTSVAIATGFERRYGVLERLAATPLQRPGIVLGKGFATAVVVVAQLLILSVLSLLLGWRPAFSVGGVLASVVIVVLAGVAFASGGLALAGRLRAEITLGLANLIYVVLAAVGGTVLAVSRYPAVVRPVIMVLPTAALGEGLRAYAHGVLPLWPLGSLLIWGVLMVLLAWKGFRWVS